MSGEKPFLGMGVGVEWCGLCLRDENHPSLVLKETHPEDSNRGSGQGRHWLDARYIYIYICLEA